MDPHTEIGIFTTGMQHQKVLENSRFQIYVMRGVCEGQVDVWESCQHAETKKAASSHPPTRYMFFGEPCSIHPPLDSPSSCPCPACPRSTTSPQNQKQAEERVKKETPAKAKTLIKPTNPLQIAYQLCFSIDKVIDDLISSNLKVKSLVT